MLNARALTDSDLPFLPGAKHRASGIRTGADWHGFRLAAINDAPLAFVAAKRQAALAANDASTAGIADLDGSLAWVGRLACWLSALFTASLLVLALN